MSLRTMTPYIPPTGADWPGICCHRPYRILKSTSEIEAMVQRDILLSNPRKATNEAARDEPWPLLGPIL